MGVSPSPTSCEMGADNHALPDDSIAISFWSVAVIVMICVLAAIFIFLVLTDFCCEMNLSQAAEGFLVHPQASVSSTCPATFLARLQPSAPPAEDDKELLKDTVVTIEDQVDDYWTSYMSFCRRISSVTRWEGSGREGEDDSNGNTRINTINSYTL